MRPEIRPVTEAEVESLEQALGKPIDRKLLVWRLSRLTRDIVRLATNRSRQIIGASSSAWLDRVGFGCGRLPKIPYRRCCAAIPISNG